MLENDISNILLPKVFALGPLVFELIGKNWIYKYDENSRKVKKCVFEIFGALDINQMDFSPLCVHLLPTKMFMDDKIVVICS